MSGSPDGRERRSENSVVLREVQAGRIGDLTPWMALAHGSGLDIYRFRIYPSCVLSNVVDPVAVALRGGPLTATGVLATLRSPRRSRQVTVGLLFWTLDGLIAGGAVLEEVDRYGDRRYRLIGSAAPVEGPNRAVVRRVDLDSKEDAESESAVRARDVEQPRPSAGRGDVIGVRFRGSLSIVTGQVSLRAQVGFEATSRARGRDQK